MWQVVTLAIDANWIGRNKDKHRMEMDRGRRRLYQVFNVASGEWLSPSMPIQLEEIKILKKHRTINAIVILFCWIEIKCDVKSLSYAANFKWMILYVTLYIWYIYYCRHYCRWYWWIATYLLVIMSLLASMTDSFHGCMYVRTDVHRYNRLSSS